MQPSAAYKNTTLGRAMWEEFGFYFLAAKAREDLSNCKIEYEKRCVEFPPTHLSVLCGRLTLSLDEQDDIDNYRNKHQHCKGPCRDEEQKRVPYAVALEQGWTFDSTGHPVEQERD